MVWETMNDYLSKHASYLQMKRGMFKKTTYLQMMRGMFKRAKEEYEQKT